MATWIVLIALVLIVLLLWSVARSLRQVRSSLDTIGGVLLSADLPERLHRLDERIEAMWSDLADVQQRAKERAPTQREEELRIQEIP
jgi:hypothetical protein